MRPRIPRWLPGLLGIALAVALAVWLQSPYAVSVNTARMFAQVMLALAVLVFILVVLILVWSSSGRVALYQICDPARAAAIFDKKLEQARQNKQTGVWQKCARYLVWAYSANGETERELILLQSLKPAGDDAAALSLYHGDMALLSWDVGNYGAFGRELELARTYAAQSVPYGRSCRKVRRRLMELTARETILNGDYATALAYYVHQVKALPFYNVYGKIAAVYLLAGIYHLMDEHDSRDQFLAYVSRRGRKLHIAALARKRLQEKTTLEISAEL